MFVFIKNNKKRLRERHEFGTIYLLDMYVFFFLASLLQTFICSCSFCIAVLFICFTGCQKRIKINIKQNKNVYKNPNNTSHNREYIFYYYLRGGENLA